MKKICVILMLLALLLAGCGETTAAPSVLDPNAIREEAREPVPEATPEAIPEPSPEPVPEPTPEPTPGPLLFPDGIIHEPEEESLDLSWLRHEDAAETAELLRRMPALQTVELGADNARAAEEAVGEAGAEELSERGSALLKTSNGAIIQVQVPLIRDEEIKEVVGSVLARYSEGEPEEKLEIDCDEALLNRAIELIRTTGRASISHFQRQLDFGYHAAAWLMDRLEEREIVGPVMGPGPREIFWKNVR